MLANKTQIKIAIEKIFDVKVEKVTTMNYDGKKKRMGAARPGQTKAWKNGRVVFVDAEAWYTTGASSSSLKLLFSDVLKGYSR